jgi:hypothetical protein
MLLGDETITFLAQAIALRAGKLSGGFKTPHLIQFHGIVTSRSMLQLGDKGARQCKKNFSQAEASTTLDGHHCPRTVIWPIQTGPKPISTP